MNHISKTSASNTDLSFVNEIIGELISGNKVNDNFKIIEEPKNGNLIQSTDEAQALVNPLSANLTKWSDTLKKFVGKLPTNCLNAFDHFVELALKGLMTK